MFGWITAFRRALFPTDGNPESIALWRITVSEVLVVLAVLMFAILIAMLVGWPLLGKLIWTSEVTRMREEGHRPLVARIENLEAKQSEIESLRRDVQAWTKATNEGFADRAAAQIRILTVRRCSSKNPSEREQINQELEVQRRQYRAYTNGANYYPSCEEL